MKPLFMVYAKNVEVKYKLKKVISLLFILILSICFLSSCKLKEDEKISVVAVNFSEYDWTKNIIGSVDSVNLTLLSDKGLDLHNYQASVEDMVKISTCDLFIHVGGESDKWVDDALKNKSNENMIILNLLSLLGEKAKEEETVEGMTHEEEDDDEIEFDEHVWLSLKNAIFYVEEIKNALIEIDPSHKREYMENATSYSNKLSLLDERYSELVSEKEKDTILFGDRFPFRYLVDDYNIKYYAAFSGCSAEANASFNTIIFLSNKVDELGLNVILILEKSDDSIARTIKDNTKNHNQQILVLDSLQSATKKEIDNGKSYYSIMEENLNVLRIALS